MNKISLRQIINGIDKDKTPKGDVSLEYLCQAAGVDFYNIDETTFYQDSNKRISSYFVRPHYCTDTWVGVQAHFLDNELVAVSTQVARKANEDYFFVSNEAAEKVKQYLLSFLVEKTMHYNLIDLDSELYNEKYSVFYNTNILHRFGWYNGEKVEIVRTNFHSANLHSEGIGSPYYFNGVEIKLADDTNKIVTTSDLLFDYNTLD